MAIVVIEERPSMASKGNKLPRVNNPRYGRSFDPSLFLVQFMVEVSTYSWTQNKFYHCFLDLQRAAVAFYLNPRGKTPLPFLKHAKKILGEDNQRNEWLKEVSRLEKKIKISPLSLKKKVNLADEILALGILIKAAGMKNV